MKNRKDKSFKKNSFMQGAFIATFGIILCKIIGILYVIPFYAIIGEQGGALYGYAYNIYSIFLGISTAGIPLAMSKLISEYHTMGYIKTKERAFRLGKKVLNVMGIISFILLMIFARPLATMIIGNTLGGNTIEDVEFVIRIISLSVLVVPIMSVYRGYFQGHKIITPTSVSQVLEQLIRVFIIIVGSFLGMKVFNLSLRNTVGIAVFSATIGAICSYLYLKFVVKKNKKVFLETEQKVKESKITNKEIVLKLLGYAFPFIMIDIFRSLYNSIDIFMLINTLVNNLGYTKQAAESIMSVISTWGLKINQIIISISTGIMISLIPNLTSSIVKEDLVDVRKKINQSLQIILYLTIPMAIGLSILSTNVWNVFYGVSEYGPKVYALYVFVSVATVLFTSSITTTQILKDYKMTFIALIIGFLVKLSLNVPLLYGFHKMGLPAYYGSIMATIIGFLTCTTMCLIFLHKKYKVDYEETLKRFINILGAVIVMTIVLLTLKVIFPIVSTSKLINIIIIVIYALLGGIIYLGITIKNKTLQKIFGDEIISKIKRKLIKKGRA
ncbi:MAG: polysaccharide biosynthesis protein [Firmicutes bacterium]|nr:polysaccharide biosynthesis protein [Bacillota bacterium]